MKTSKEMRLTKVSELVPYANNARTHSDEQVMKLRSSLREFGFVNPVLVDKDNNIIAGHGRIMAAKAEGIEEVPCVLVEHLTEAQKKAYILADNRLAEDAGWDMELVDLELDTLREMDFDISLTGFEMDELSFDMADDKEVEEDDFDVDGVLDEIVEPISKRGDIWQLGKHRLMCGDSTTNDVDTLMYGKKADITFTSPPYNVGSTPKEKGKYHNDKSLDNKSKVDYVTFLDLFTLNSLKYSDFVFTNIQSVSNNKIALIEHLYNLREKYADTMIWHKGKGQPAMAHRVLNSAFEYIYIYSNEGTRSIGKKDFRGTIPNIFELSPNKGKEYSDIHKATFRIELPSMFIKWFTENSVYDPFGGTGTTLIAAEQLNRICYMMELDEKYCDVIIKRWEEYTGNKAELIEG